MTVLIGIAVLLPASKILMDRMFPYFVSNVGGAIDLSVPWWFYPVCYLVIIGLYFLISRLLVRNLKQISPAVVLKNRE